MTRRRLIALGGGAFLLAALARTAVPVDAQGPGQAEFFEQRVRPVLAESCLGCHDSTAMGGLRLDSRESVLKVVYVPRPRLPGERAPQAYARLDASEPRNAGWP